MTHSQKLMLEELDRRNYSQNTARAYLRTIDDIARRFGRPAEQLGPEDIREYQSYLFRERHLAADTVNQRVGALRFFYNKTLKRNWNVEEAPYPKRTFQLPTILIPSANAIVTVVPSHVIYRTHAVKAWVMRRCLGEKAIR